MTRHWRPSLSRSPRRVRSSSLRGPSLRSPPHARRPRVLGQGVELLEDRRLLSLAPAGPEFLVNPLGPSTPSLYANVIATDPAGNFIVAWETFQDDTNRWEVYAHRYNAAGASLGGDFRVNTTIAGDQLRPDVAVDAEGNSVIIWRGIGQSGGGIYAQRYDALGQPLGGESLVSGISATGQEYPSVAIDADGDFVVTWRSYQSGAGRWIAARRFSANGVPAGDEFTVSSPANSDETPVVAMDADGDFVVAWSSYGLDGNNWGIFAQRYSASGAPQGTLFQVNTYTASYQIDPSIGMDANGNFVIAWTSHDQVSSGVYDVYGENDVFAQRFAADGTPLGGEFRVNKNFYASEPSVAMNAAGDFVVGWNHGSFVYLRRFGPAGEDLGDEVLGAVYEGSGRHMPAVAIDSNRHVVGVWQRQTVGNQYAFYARQFVPAIAPTSPALVEVNVLEDAPNSVIDLWAAFAEQGLPDSQLTFTIQSFSSSLFSARTVNNSNGTLTLDYAADQYGTTDVVVRGTDPVGRYAETIYRAKVAAVADAAIVSNSQTVMNTQTTTGLSVLSSVADSYPFDVGEIYFQITDITNGKLYLKDGVTPILNGAFISETQGLAGLRFTPALDSLAQGSFRVEASLTPDVSGLGGAPVIARIEVQTPISSTLGKLEADILVNDTDMTASRIDPDVASDAQGNFVVTWRQVLSDGFLDQVMARRYDSAGVPLGDEFRVSTLTSDGQVDPAIAMNASGEFVIAWHNSFDGSFEGIRLQRFASDGLPVGAPIAVPRRSDFHDVDPHVAIDADGDIVVVWTNYGHDTPSYDIYAQRYSAEGTPLGTDFRVNTSTTGKQTAPVVAMDADGDFVVGWVNRFMALPQGGGGIYARRFNAAGVPQESEARVNTFTYHDQFAPAIAMDAAGNFVIAWEDYGQGGIYFQRFDAAGVPQGIDLRANSTAGPQRPAVAMTASGSFVVTWARSAPGGSDNAIYAQRFSPTADPVGSEFRVTGSPINEDVWPYNVGPAVAIDDAERFVVVWQGPGPTLYQLDSDIYAQRLSSDPPTRISELKARPEPADRIKQDDVLIEGPAQLLVVFDAAMMTSGPGAATNPANWRIVENGADVSSRISGIDYTFDPMTAEGVATLHLSTRLGVGSIAVRAMNLVDANGQALDGDSDYVPGGGYLRSFTVIRQHVASGEIQVNTLRQGRQNDPAIAVTPDGSYVVAWTSADQDGSGDGVYAKLHDLSTDGQQNEIQVNTYTQGHQRAAAIAADGYGNFIVAWQSADQDGSGWGIYAQRFSQMGMPLGGEFLVNTYTTGDQIAPAVAMDLARAFVITWESADQDGSGRGVYSRRFDAAGVPQGSESRVNTFTTGDQSAPAIAVDAGGNFVVTWQSMGQDGSGAGVYLQQFNALGAAQGSEQRVNTYTAGD